MRRHVLRLSLLIALCSLASISVPRAQAPAPTGSAAFAGRWEFSVQPATGPTAGNSTPYLIVQIAASDAGLTASVVDTFMSPLFTGKVKGVSVKDGQLELIVDVSGREITFQGRRVGDRLEGTTKIAGVVTEGKWTAKTTTEETLPPPETVAGGTPDAKALSAAMNNPREARTVALKQFLVDFPTSPLAPQASFTLAQGIPSTAERVVAYQRFVADYPKSTQADDARLQIALLSPTAESGPALRKFIADFPASRLRERAEYELTRTITNAADRQAAEEKFVAAYPKSSYVGEIYRLQLEPLLRAKPVNEARLNVVIDGFINASSDLTMPLNAQTTMNLRAGAMNTVADRLMANEVMLDRALDIIQKALALAGEKEEPGSRAMFTTTHGQVLFKLKRYDEAGDALKRAVQISGGDGETHLFLGKFYEVKGDEDAALAAYMKAYEMGSPLDTRVSLERLYIKKYGSIASLETKLDEMYLAKPKPFQPGHYTRPAAPTGKTVLAELFTGAECVPCVAADLAFDGLTERYDRESVAVLVYHLHIPGPDPMTNDDTEARAKVYEVKATPTAVIDGAALPASGGSATMAERAFNDYKGKIEPRLAAKPLASLAGIKAKLSGETIAVTGDVTLSPDFAAGSTAALHVVLVEDSIRYVGANGVRFHDFVVRKLMGTPAGTPLTKAGAKTPFSESVSLSSVTTSLDAYLDKYEKTRSERAPFKFKERVDTLDPKKMLVVVFAQDEKTREILQSAVVTVER